MKKHPSKELIEFVKRWETYKAVAYLPTKDDRWTVGYGATFHKDGTPVKQGDVMTEKDATDLLEYRLQKICDNLIPKLKFDIQQHQLDAVLSLLDNVGVAGFLATRSGQMLIAGDDISKRIPLWNYQGNKVLLGLTKRRAAELAIYTKKDYNGKP